jgi:Tol biopolymer transport system component
LLVVRRGALYAQKFDPDRIELTGNLVKVAEQVPGDSRRVAVSASAAGPVVYRSGTTVGQRQFEWVDRSGTALRSVGEPDSNTPLSPSMSPDGERVAVHRTKDGNVDIWTLDLTRGVLDRFTTDVGNDIFPIWSPHGDRIIFSSRRGANVYELYERPVTRVGSEHGVLKTPIKFKDDRGSAGGRFATDWSRDGRFLLYRTHAPSTGWDIWALSLEGDQALIPIAQTEFDESNPQFSPDGHWVAYESDKTGRFEIYVRPFPGPGVDTPISTHGGAQVRWRPDGTELFYIALNGELTAVPIHSSDQQIRATGAPLTLFPTRLGDPVQQLSGALYIVSEDGQRFLMNSLLQSTTTSPLTVVLNWKP